MINNNIYIIVNVIYNFIHHYGLLPLVLTPIGTMWYNKGSITSRRLYEVT